MCSSDLGYPRGRRCGTGGAWGNQRMSFLAELKRRNVIRMAGLYLVGAWLITQVAGTILPMFDAPDWVARTVVVLLAIGFIPALVISWVFELTPDGLRREDESVPAEPTDSTEPNTARRMNRMIVVVLLLALGYFAVDKFLLVPSRDSAGEPATKVSDQPNSASPAAASQPDAAKSIDTKSIAVLAFANMSSDKDNEYFSDGVAEEILNALAQVRELKVAGRTSSFYFKGRSAPSRMRCKASCTRQHVVTARPTQHSSAHCSLTPPMSPPISGRRCCNAIPATSRAAKAGSSARLRSTPCCPTH